MTQIVSIPNIASSSISAELHAGVISIGNFDGVHRGHASLLEQTKQLAEQLSGPAIACLFDPHPIAILRPELSPKRLTSLAERARRMERFGIDFLIVCKTTPDLLNLTAEAFFQILVRDQLKCRGMVEGANFCFGKDRGGNVDLLRNLCQQESIEFQLAPMKLIDEQVISSTRIRNLLEQGNVRKAGELMQIPHSITSRVVRGDQRGRTIGFPTANLESVDVVVPQGGVYAGWAQIDHSRFPAAIHIGESPTFQSGHSSKIEVHLIDYQGDLYDTALRVEFIERVRGIQHFDSPQSLTKQLRQDVATVKQLLETAMK